MNADSVRCYQIYRQTANRLEVLSARVAENRDVMAASEFCRWLAGSGVLEFLEANPQPPPLNVDGPLLRWQCKELLSACNERFARNDAAPHVSGLELQSIHEKLNLVAGYLSRLTCDGETVSVERGETASEAVPVLSPLLRQELPVRHEDFEQPTCPAVELATVSSELARLVLVSTEASPQSSGWNGCPLSADESSGVAGSSGPLGATIYGPLPDLGDPAPRGRPRSGLRAVNRAGRPRTAGNLSEAKGA